MMIEGEPWFHATDACVILGLATNGGVYRHTVKLDADEKQTLHRTKNLREGSFRDQNVFIGLTGQATAISESGLYKLIMRSDKPEAKAFQDWVTKEVLPSIRKNP